MFREIVVCFSALLCVDRPALCQADKTQPPAAPSAVDEQYRKFAEISEWVRARNARDYAMPSASGIDEGSYVTIGGIEQWITIRVRPAGSLLCIGWHGAGRGRGLLRPFAAYLRALCSYELFFTPET